jgi:hypothetical protein
LSQQFCPAVQHWLMSAQQVLLQQVGLPLASWQQFSPAAQQSMVAPQQVPLQHVGSPFASLQQFLPGAQHWPPQTLAARAPKIDPGQQTPSKQEAESQHVAEAPLPHNVLNSGQHL